MRLRRVICAIFAVFCSALLLRKSGSAFASLYIDSHGEEWRTPTVNIFNFAADWLINVMPRGTLKFKRIDTSFDMDNNEYLQSSLLYIIFGLGLALVFCICCIIFVISRYCCNCCGGGSVPRAGYSDFQIDSTRGSILVFSFLLEAMLIYGYFTNADLDRAIGSLSSSFKAYSNELGEQFRFIIKTLPDNMSSFYNKAIFEADLKYSINTAQTQSNYTLGLFNSFESYRMALIIVGLVCATLACSVGIAAGAVHRAWPITVMVVFSIIGAFILLFSFSAHFAGSKMLHEFCQDSAVYVDSRNEQFLPQRLQFFIQCVSSPLYRYISDYYFINAIMRTEKFLEKFDMEALGDKPFTFQNITDKYYDPIINEKIKNDTSLKSEYTHVMELVNPAQVIDQSKTCRWSKSMLRNEQFVMCHFSKDALDMLMFSQGIAAILMIITTIIALGAIKKFKWSMINNAGRLFGTDPNQGFAGRTAMPKRIEE